MYSFTQYLTILDNTVQSVTSQTSGVKRSIPGTFVGYMIEIYLQMNKFR